MGTIEETLLVGIDVGMTCTGVAYSVKGFGLEMVDPYTIQDWPGNAQSADKVPTTVCYHDGRVSSWGFLTRNEDDQALVHEWFKTFFDEDVYEEARKRDPSQVPSSHAEVRRYYKDFLTKLYPEIRRRLEDRVSDWTDGHVEFLFSVPTTWTKIGLATDFKKIAQDAGFGQDGKNHVVDVGLTEAEAAACHTFTAQSAVYSNDNVILVVDAGGGTTDLALLKVQKKGSEPPLLTPLDEVRGDEIGSVEIDIEFSELVEKRLHTVAQDLRLSPKQQSRLITRMVREKFRTVKEDFGKSDVDARDLDVKIEMPGVSDTYSSKTANVYAGKMYFKRSDIKRIFDNQLAKMFRLIDHQLDKMITVAPGDRVTQIVLSGGLGSSQYLKDEMINRYARNSQHEFAPDVRIMSSLRPQLAVVKGLVQDRMSKLKTKKPILGARKSRQSLGLIVNQQYVPHKHQGADLMTDPIDGQTYAKNQVVWFVKQGETIDRDYIEETCFRTFRKDQRTPWLSLVAICNNRTTTLPTSLKGDGVKVLCKMKSDLTQVPLVRFEKKKKSWYACWDSFETHYKAQYKIRFQLKPAHIDSEMWFGGQKYGDASFEVMWEDGAKMAAPREHRRSSPDRYRAR